MGLEKGLRTNRETGLSLDEHTFVDSISFEEATGGPVGYADRHLPVYYLPVQPQEDQRGEYYDQLRCPLAAYRNRSRSDMDTGSDIKRQRQWEIPGLLQGIKVEAIPDYGSDLDIISEAFVRRNNWKIRILSRNSAPKIRLPTGGEVQSLGNIKLPFSFTGEPDVFERTFTVVKHCIHDIVLGNKFLKLTKTLSHHYHRLKERVRAKCSRTPRLCLLNSSSERIRGSINGSSTNAYPDTGSDVMVISKREATRLGLHIDTDEGSRTFLQFADGSYHYTDGMVYGAEWQFGYGGYGTGHSIRCDLHVLDQLSCDVILSNEFLFDNQVFVNYQHCFYDMHMGKISAWPGHDDYNTAKFCLIKERKDRKSMLESLKAFFGSPAERTSDPEAIAIDSDPVRQQAIAQYREICRQGDEEDRIAGLPQQEQFAAMEAERLRRNEWLRTHNPIYSPPISSSSSPSAIPPSSCPSSSMNVHASFTEPANPPTGTWLLRTLRLIRAGR